VEKVLCPFAITSRATFLSAVYISCLPERSVVTTDVAETNPVEPLPLPFHPIRSAFGFVTP
jgi:hypothetical protein